MQSDRSEFSLVFGRALGRVVVSIHGPVNAETAGELQDRLVDLIDGQGNRNLVIELDAMTAVDSAGLSVFVDALKRMQRIAGELVLSGARDNVLRAFRSAGLDKVFAITPSWSHPATGFGRNRLGSPAGWGCSG